jgi:hypothetical protein
LKIPAVNEHSRKVEKCSSACNGGEASDRSCVDATDGASISNLRKSSASCNAGLLNLLARIERTTSVFHAALMRRKRALHSLDRKSVETIAESCASLTAACEVEAIPMAFKDYQDTEILTSDAGENAK